MEKTLALACDLIRQPSVTPQDAGCQQQLMQRLQAIGFHCTAMRFGEVDNFWAERGSGGRILVFAGHTDVVPPGHWSSGTPLHSSPLWWTASSTAAAPPI